MDKMTWAWTISDKVLSLAKKMGIVNAEPGTQAGWLTGYPDWIRASSYAAWGAYNLAS